MVIDVYKRQTYNVKQEATITSYFTPDNKEVIVINHLTKDVILNWKDKVYIFKNKSEFVVFYLKEAGYDLSRILYNSLATPFLTTMNLPNSGQDVLFWQEPITDSVPGNMRLLLDSNHRQTKIVVQEYAAYTNLDVYKRQAYTLCKTIDCLNKKGLQAFHSLIK